MVCSHSQSVKFLAPANLLVLGVLMFYFVYQILSVLYFLSSTGVPKAAAEPCGSVQPTAQRGSWAWTGLTIHPLLLGIILLVQFIPGLCFPVHIKHFIFKEDKEEKKFPSQTTTHLLVHCYKLLPQLTFYIAVKLKEQIWFSLPGSCLKPGICSSVTVRVVGVPRCESSCGVSKAGKKWKNTSLISWFWQLWHSDCFCSGLGLFTCF